MTPAEIQPVLAFYPADCQPLRVEALGGAGGFSGAKLWRLTTPRGTLCLRRWPKEHPTPERLEFIQGVLTHVERRGFALVPVPISLPIDTRRSHISCVQFAGHLWELTPWQPGRADYHQRPTPGKLQSAMSALAAFHRAAADFPLPERGPRVAPSILDRLRQVDELSAGGLVRLAGCMARHRQVELDVLAQEWLRHAPRAIDMVRPRLLAAAQIALPIQPCIRDIWHDHVLFDGDDVSGLVDFGAMRPDAVPGDVARLLRSLVRGDEALWREGLDHYQRLRPLSDAERAILPAFDASAALLAPANWIGWVYAERRQFPDWAAVRARLAEPIHRLRRMV